MFLSAKPVWFSPECKPDEYTQTAETFPLSSLPGSAILRIAADSDYTIFVNGQLAAFGQYANYPFRRFYDELDILPYLRIGHNELSVLGWYYGVNSSTYCCGTAFVCYEIEADSSILLASGPDTQARPAPGYVPYQVRKISPQLGLTFSYDCTAKPESFRQAMVVDIGTTEWNPRPVAKLVLKERYGTEYVHQGQFQSKQDPDPQYLKPHYAMDYAALSWQPLQKLAGRPKAKRQQDPANPLTFNLPNCPSDGGIYWIVDLMEETAGFLDLDLEVPKDCDLYVGYGEHLRDGRCRTAVRNFSCSLRLKKGRNQYLNTFRRFGCRYLQFFLYSSSVTIHYSGLRPTVYPVTLKEYRSGNLLRDTIYQVAQNTLLHCMHEHYEDCPWREQALYAMDSRNQMLCGYYAFNETRFPRACLELISYGQRSDGLLSLCYPAGSDLPIPSFSLVWFIAMREYIQYSGDTTLARERFAVLERLIDTFHKNRADNGLLNTFRSDSTRYWNFYEWSETMDGHDYSLPAAPEAPLNAFYCLALDSMAAICQALDKPADTYKVRASAIRALLSRHFFNSNRGLFRSFTDRDSDRYSVLTNALCLLCGAADGLDTKEIEHLLACNGENMPDCIPDTLSMQCFRFDALLCTNRAKYAPIILDEIDRNCLHMLRNGATTFWETIKGEADFSDAGSLCHGWSALPIYYYETLCK